MILVRFTKKSKNCKFLAEFLRVFWLIAFFIGVTAAGLLINDVWDRYNRVPVIVSFLPVEMDIEFIPFPALTICNMNPIPKSQVDEILKYMASELRILISTFENFKF